MYDITQITYSNAVSYQKIGMFNTNITEICYKAPN